jgi:hypothetical protein
MAAGATYQVAGVELARRKTEPDSATANYAYTSDEESEREDVNKIMEARKRYGQDRQNKQLEWTESFKMYMSWIDTAFNPFVSNLFIPKTHEAVELLSAFLIGDNQSIHATPENGSSNPQKALVASRWLDFMWRKVLKARFKILIWIKQSIVFGNGLMKVGFDAVDGKPWMEVRPIEDVYFDYWMPHLQDSEYVIDEIRRMKEEVMADEKYDAKDKEGNLIRSQVIVGGPEGEGFATSALFNTFDGSMASAQCAGKVLCLEVHCKSDNAILTLLPTSLGWRIARKKPNPNYYDMPGAKLYFRPFVKLRFKPSPVPNRAYDTGAVYPTIGLQKAFNDLYNEYFDAVVQLGAPMWLKRRGARINPAELVRRPGGVVTVSDINKDLRREQVGDVPASVLDMLNRLDREFEQASMVVNLLKGVSESQTATGDALAQRNIETMLAMIEENLVDALSELGQMTLAIATLNTDGVQSIKFFETDQEIGMLEFDPKKLDGMIDLIIRPDRDTHGPLSVQQKQLLDFANLVRSDIRITLKYPDIMEKIYKRFLENGGIADADFFFQANMTPGAGPDQNPLAAMTTDRPKVAMSYKDAPDDVRREIEQAAGLTPSTMAAPAAPAAPSTPALAGRALPPGITPISASAPGALASAAPAR